MSSMMDKPSVRSHIIMHTADILNKPIMVPEVSPVRPMTSPTLPVSTTLDMPSSRSKAVKRPWEDDHEDAYPSKISKTDTPFPILHPHLQERFLEYKKTICKSVEKQTQVHVNMQRKQANAGATVDPDYAERRKKNNEAARRSREARREKELQNHMICSFFEVENSRINCEIAQYLASIRQLEEEILRIRYAP